MESVSEERASWARLTCRTRTDYAFSPPSPATNIRTKKAPTTFKHHSANTTFYPKNMIKTYFLTAICSLLLLIACHDGEGETVESTYMLPIEQVPEYKYSRSGLSTVDQWECTMTKNAATYIYESFLQKAYIHDDDAMRRLKEAFEEGQNAAQLSQQVAETAPEATRQRDRKSTRLNSSHANISYAV